jgi:hypothetical protein
VEKTALCGCIKTIKRRAAADGVALLVGRDAARQMAHVQSPLVNLRNRTPVERQAYGGQFSCQPNAS